MAGTTVYDPDGVGGCLKAALDDAKIAWNDADVRSIMGIPKPVAIAELAERVGVKLSPAQIDTIHRDFQERMIFHYRSSDEVREILGAAGIFRVLRHHGVKVALDTGFDRSIVEVLLERLGWDDGLLDATAASDEVPRGRPYPDLVHRLMELTGVTDPKEVAKVGDTASDLQEGTAAGCGLVVGVTTGSFTRSQLESYPHSHVLDSLAELPNIVANA